MRGLTVYDDKLFEFEATDAFLDLNKDKAKFIIPDMELDSNPNTYSRNRSFFERVKAYTSKYEEIPIYFIGDILNNPKGKAEDGTDICGEFLNWFSTLKNKTYVIRGNGEMDLCKDGILNASLTKDDDETYVLKFGKDEYEHVIYIKQLPNETEDKIKKRIQNVLEKIYNNNNFYEYLTDEKIILTHAPLLNYVDHGFDITIDKKIIKQSSGKTKPHPTSIKGKEKCYDDARTLFHYNDEIKYNIAGHVPIYDDWNIIKYDDKFCILTNDEPYYEKFDEEINGKYVKVKYYANPGHIFDGSRKIFVLFDGIEPPSNKKSIDDTDRYLKGLLQNKKIFGGYSSEIMMHEYYENTFARLLLFLFFVIVIVLIVSLISVNIYYKNNISINQT